MLIEATHGARDTNGLADGGNLWAPLPGSTFHTNVLRGAGDVTPCARRAGVTLHQRAEPGAIAEAAGRALHTRILRQSTFLAAPSTSRASHTVSLGTRATAVVPRTSSAASAYRRSFFAVGSLWTRSTWGTSHCTAQTSRTTSLLIRGKTSLLQRCQSAATINILTLIIVSQDVAMKILSGHE